MSGQLIDESICTATNDEPAVFTLEKLERALEMIHKTDLSDLPSKGFVRSLYLDYLKTKLIPPVISPSQVTEGHMSMFMGFPVIIDETLPYPVVMRVIDHNGKTVYEIKAPYER